MIWDTPKIWPDGECYILGGGPSLPRQFDVPEEIINGVMNKKIHPSSYSEYLAPIHQKHCIGVNNIYQIGNWIDALFFGDCCWYLVHKKPLAEFPGIKVTCCNRFINRRESEMEGIKYVQKNSSRRLGITSDDKTKLSWNSNSGAAAINLAIHFGVKRIVLLGFDMKMDVTGFSHWHGSHKNPNEKKKNPPFARHLRGFPQIKKDADALGVEIINACPDSAITSFPKLTLKEALG